MAKFDCNWCAKCCQSFGEFIRIERQLTGKDYYCRYGITNELFLVHVEPEFADEIADDFEETGGKDPDRKGCFFSRKNPAGKGFACAIYATRPSICKDFECYRMLIHHPASGETRGRIIGINELKSRDEALILIWSEKIAHLPHPIHAKHDEVQHSHAPGAHAVHGHDSHILAHVQNLHHTDDHEWVNNVVAILAAHGYHGDPVED
jgi:Fe-S-cluster containining protein